MVVTVLGTIAVLALQARYVSARVWRLPAGCASDIQALVYLAAVIPLGPTAGLTSIPVAAFLLDRRWIRVSRV